MQLSQYQGLPRVTIDPGESYVTRKDEMIFTLLGSCVAACLYDPENHVIGMNHFLLANQPVNKGSLLASEGGRYGIHAMELLINEMLKHGAQRPNLKAKAFGGADILKQGDKSQQGRSIGAINCKFIKKFLNTEGIPLITSCLGGYQGRNIFFLPHDFSVYVKNIERAEEQTVIKMERYFMEKSTLAHATQSSNRADFW